MFCSFVGEALLDDHTEHAQKATESPQMHVCYFVLEIFLWEVGTYGLITAVLSAFATHDKHETTMYYCIVNCGYSNVMCMDCTVPVSTCIFLTVSTCQYLSNCQYLSVSF